MKSTLRTALTVAAAMAALLLAAPMAHAGEGPNVTDAEGRCETPQQALYTVLYWLQPERYDPGRAAACIDRSALKEPSREAPLVAENLKKLLDARGLYVMWEDIPDKADYEKDGEAQFGVYPDTLGGVNIVKKDTRWVISSASLDRINELYRKTVPAGFDDIVKALPEWLRGRVVGLQVWQLLGIVLLIFLGLGVQRLVVFLFATYLRRIAGKLNVTWIQKVINKADRPVGGLVMAGVFAAGIPLLQFPVRLSAISMLAIRVMAAFSVVWLGYRLVDVLCDALGDRAAKTDTKLDDQLVPLVRKSLKVFLVLIGGIFILQNLSVDVGSLLAGLGLGGLAFALAAKDTVANFFGSVMIFIDKPFQIGDWIKMSADVEGTVEEVGFRTTRIRTFYNSVVTVPNALVTNTPIDNLGVRRYRRYKGMLGLTYDTPPEKVQAFCEGVRAIIQSLPGMRKDFYLVEFQGFGASSLDVLLYCFMDVPDWAAELRTRTNLNLEILRLAQNLGVSFAFPTQTLHIESLPAKDAPKVDGKAADTGKLADIVRAFGPGGKLSLKGGFEITQGFDAGQATGSRGSADADG